MAEELLTEIELEKLAPAAITRKASRLARLLDDVDAMSWLRYETAGFPKGQLDADATMAAQRSNRVATVQNGAKTYWTTSLGELGAQIDAGKAQLSSETSATSGGEWDLVVSRETAARRNALTKFVGQSQGILEAVIGAIHDYVAGKYQELRFGSAVESAFEIVRGDVDARIGALVPDALPMITGALENAASDNPEHWSNAASTCRRLLKAVADKLRPASPDVTRPDGPPIKMGDGNYLNRLGDWIRQQTSSETTIAVFEAELEYVEAQLKAADKAGQKGAHDVVTKLEASRYVAGTYLILGDILRLRADDAGEVAAAPVAEAVSPEVDVLEVTPAQADPSDS